MGLASCMEMVVSEGTVVRMNLEMRWPVMLVWG
jgi:hypothetical protein